MSKKKSEGNAGLMEARLIERQAPFCPLSPGQYVDDNEVVTITENPHPIRSHPRKSAFDDFVQTQMTASALRSRECPQIQEERSTRLMEGQSPSCPLSPGQYIDDNKAVTITENPRPIRSHLRKSAFDDFVQTRMTADARRSRKCPQIQQDRSTRLMEGLRGQSPSCPLSPGQYVDDNEAVTITENPRPIRSHPRKSAFDDFVQTRMTAYALRSRKCPQIQQDRSTRLMEGLRGQSSSCPLSPGQYVDDNKAVTMPENPRPIRSHPQKSAFDDSVQTRMTAHALRSRKWPQIQEERSAEFDDSRSLATATRTQRTTWKSSPQLSDQAFVLRSDRPSSPTLPA